ncbi:MAG: segregation/condensation protein A [Bryobacterales bacterium]|nr:segregation/condensation protein A [Bryobacterales bacterium]
MSAASPPREPFDGPLDLLLDEVRRQRIAIEEVALAPLVARYLDYLQAAAARQLPLDIDWILLAATLIQWKSRSLLPAAPGTSAPDPIRDEIVELLLAHRKQAAEDLGRRRSEEAGRLSRGGDPGFQEEEQVEEDLDPPFVSVWDLTQQARDLARWAAQQSQQRRQWRESFPGEDDDVTIAAMSEYLQAQFAAGGSALDASQLLAQQPTPLRRVYLFLAMLEMARNQQLRILQPEEFARILLVPPLLL